MPILRGRKNLPSSPVRRTAVEARSDFLSAEGLARWRFVTEWMAYGLEGRWQIRRFALPGWLLAFGLDRGLVVSRLPAYFDIAVVNDTLWIVSLNREGPVAQSDSSLALWSHQIRRLLVNIHHLTVHA